MKRTESVTALQLSLHGQKVAVVVHYSGGKNILAFDPEYVAIPESRRPVMTLTQRLSPEYFSSPIMNSQRIPPILSNLLPEGALRTWMAQQLKVHDSDEFALLAWAGKNLPGAVVADSIPAGEIPDWALSSRDQVEPVQIDVGVSAQKFSLAGVQIKFSSTRHDGRFNIGTEQDGGDSWIVKTPSTFHSDIPLNEYTVMRLAEAISIEIPEIDLVDLTTLDNLPDIRLPDEPKAYIIKRFDRTDSGRIHTEDFAQVFGLYAHDKYGQRSYGNIATVLYAMAGGLPEVQQMARRLLANILLANGDAHLKNWSLIYLDTMNAKLTPAYDIVFTLPYVPGETGIALNLDHNKEWYKFQMKHFENWSTKAGVSWPAVKVHLQDAISIARERWPTMLEELPMRDDHKELLKKHWAALHEDFRIR